MRKTVLIALAAFGLLVSSSCSRYPEPKNLDPESREFYSKVRYIITKEERASFLRLNPDERPAFIKEFWERRDPTPGTEINEFKDRYFQRIDEANRLFKEGSTPGWLQDRGRIYITIGPPDNRETYPRGVDFYGFPQEVWWYGFFPVVFIDEDWSGNYRLTPLGAQHISEMTRAQREEQKMARGEQPERRPVIEYEIGMEKAGAKTIFIINIPYKAIWFKAEDENFKTTLEVNLTVMGEDDKTVWNTKRDFDISVSRAEGLELFEKTYEMRFEAEIAPGSYKLLSELINKTGGGRSQKTLDIEI